MDTIHEWAKTRANELRQDIREYIELGWDVREAVEKVLAPSNIGAGYKAQIRYEFKYYEVTP